MISKAVSGGGFKGAVGYISDPAKAEHVELRGLASVRTAPKEMRAVADQSGRVEKPVYHFTISWAPDEQPTREQMIEAADRMSERLGLHDCQRVYAIHHDTKHRHIHIVANRVNPNTGTAVKLSNDRWKRAEVCREIEREQGWQAVKTPERGEKEKFKPFSEGELSRQRRDGREPFAQVIDEHAGPAFQEARSWDELAANLEAQGLRLETWRSGLVVTDGTERTKASAFGRQCSRQRLEERFGETFDDFQGRRQAGALKQETEQQSKEIANVRKPGIDHYDRRGFHKPGQPDLEPASQGAPAQSIDSVRDLSGIPVARHDGTPHVLLPRDEGHELEQPGAGGTGSLRRAGADRLTARGQDGPSRRRREADPTREALFQAYRQHRQEQWKAAGAAHKARWSQEAARRTQERDSLKKAQAANRWAIMTMTRRGLVRSVLLGAQAWWNRRQWARLRKHQDERWTAEKTKLGRPAPTTFRAFLERRAPQDQAAARVLADIRRVDLRRQDLAQIYPAEIRTLHLAMAAEDRFHRSSRAAGNPRLSPAERDTAQADALTAQREAVMQRRAFADWARGHPTEAARITDQVKRERGRNQVDQADQVKPAPSTRAPIDIEHDQPRPAIEELTPRRPLEERQHQAPSLAAGADTYRAWKEAEAKAAAANRRNRESPEAVMQGIEAARRADEWWRWANQHPTEAREIEDQAKAARAAARSTAKVHAQDLPKVTAQPAPPVQPEKPIPPTAADRWPAGPQQDRAERAELERAARSQIIAEIHQQRAAELQRELESGLVRRHLAGEPPEVIAQVRDAIVAKDDPEAELRLDQVLGNEMARAEREQQPDRAAELEALRGPVTKRLQNREPAPKIDTGEQEKPRDRATELQRELESGLVRRHLSDFTPAELEKARDAILQKADPAAERRLDQVLANEAHRASGQRQTEIEALRQPILDRLADRDSPIQQPPGRGPRRR